MAGREAILSTNGPMSADRDSLELFMKVMLDAEPWKLEPSIRVAPWIPYGFTRPLKIAVQWWDGVVKPHPPMIRALREVSDACEKAGMTVVDWECESLDHKKGWEILSGLYFPDGGKEVLGLLESAGEPILPLTNFIIKDQPAVKELTVPELFKVCQVGLNFWISRPCVLTLFVSFLTAMRGARSLSYFLCTSLD
jgi:hypothetical protein